MPELMGLSATPKVTSARIALRRRLGVSSLKPHGNTGLELSCWDLELTNLRAERRTIEDSIEDWRGDLNLLDLAAVGVANLRFRT
jgi:hypothetical protein